jgi:peroxiredoxin Q/BCP
MTNQDPHRSITEGSAARDFSLLDQNGSEWRLGDQRGQVTVLLFYPQNETLVCTRQLCAVRDHWQDYLQTRANIVGVSPAATAEHLAFAEKYRLPITLLADEGRVVTRRFAAHRFLPVSTTRGIVIIDADGVVRRREIMLRAFRPDDSDLIAAIYAARADAFQTEYRVLQKRIRRIVF